MIPDEVRVEQTITLCLDVAILLLPVIAVARMQMDWRKKVGVVAIFGTGAL